MRQTLRTTAFATIGGTAESIRRGTRPVPTVTFENKPEPKRSKRSLRHVRFGEPDSPDKPVRAIAAAVPIDSATPVEPQHQASVGKTSLTDQYLASTRSGNPVKSMPPPAAGESFTQTNVHRLGMGNAATPDSATSHAPPTSARFSTSNRDVDLEQSANSTTMLRRATVIPNHRSSNATTYALGKPKPAPPRSPSLTPTPVSATGANVPRRHRTNTASAPSTGPAAAACYPPPHQHPHRATTVLAAQQA